MRVFFGVLLALFHPGKSSSAGCTPFDYYASSDGGAQLPEPSNVYLEEDLFLLTNEDAPLDIIENLSSAYRDLIDTSSFEYRLLEVPSHGGSFWGKYAHEPEAVSATMWAESKEGSGSGITSSIAQFSDEVMYVPPPNMNSGEQALSECTPMHVVETFKVEVSGVQACPTVAFRVGVCIRSVEDGPTSVNFTKSVRRGELSLFQLAGDDPEGFSMRNSTVTILTDGLRGDLFRFGCPTSKESEEKLRIPPGTTISIFAPRGVLEVCYRSPGPGDYYYASSDRFRYFFSEFDQNGAALGSHGSGEPPSAFPAVVSLELGNPLWVENKSLEANEGQPLLFNLSGNDSQHGSTPRRLWLTITELPDGAILQDAATGEVIDQAPYIVDAPHQFWFTSQHPTLSPEGLSMNPGPAPAFWLNYSVSAVGGAGEVESSEAATISFNVRDTQQHPNPRWNSSMLSPPQFLLQRRAEFESFKGELPYIETWGDADSFPVTVSVQYMPQQYGSVFLRTDVSQNVSSQWNDVPLWQQLGVQVLSSNVTTPVELGDLLLPDLHRFVEEDGSSCVQQGCESALILTGPPSVVDEALSSLQVAAFELAPDASLLLTLHGKSANSQYIVAVSFDVPQTVPEIPGMISDTSRTSNVPLTSWIGLTLLAVVVVVRASSALQQRFCAKPKQAPVHVQEISAPYYENESITKKIDIL